MLAIVILLGSTLSNEDIAREAEAAFDRGLTCLQRGERSRAHFLAAVEGYEELRRRGVRNAPLERNLGNAYLLADDVPNAILAYRRGLRLSPGDRGLRLNLAEARQRVIFFEGTTLGRPPENVRPAWLPHWPRGLFAIAALAYAVTWIAFTRWYMVRRRTALVCGLGATGLALASTALLIATWRVESATPVVVIAKNDVVLRKGNGVAFPPRHETALNRGVEARLRYRLDGWLQIELSGGEVGWVAESEAVVEEE